MNFNCCTNNEINVYIVIKLNHIPQRNCKQNLLLNNNWKEQYFVKRSPEKKMPLIEVNFQEITE